MLFGGWKGGDSKQAEVREGARERERDASAGESVLCSACLYVYVASMPRPLVRAPLRRLIRLAFVATAITLALSEDGDRDVVLAVGTLAALLPRLRRQRRMPHGHHTRLDLEHMSDDECVLHFRFKKCQLPLLQEALDIPDEVSIPTREKFSGMEALCVLLARLASQKTLAGHVPMFGLSEETLSRIFLHMVHNIVDRYHHLLIDPSLWAEHFETFADAIFDRTQA